MFGYGYGYGTRVSTALAQALIDYRDWTAYTDVDGKRYITDKGASPKYPLALNSGSGVYIKGTDDLIPIPINQTIGAEAYIKDGVLVVNDNVGAITDLVIDTVGAYKDYYLFTRNLTQTEKDAMVSQPEQFFIDAKNDNTCVLNMPMNEDKDGTYSGHVIDYSEFSEVEKTTNGEFLTDTSWDKNSWWAISNGVATMPLTVDFKPLVQDIGAVNGGWYLVVVDITSIVGNIKIAFLNDTQTLEQIIARDIVAVGKYTFLVKNNSAYNNIHISRTTPNTASSCTVESTSVKQISGIHEITNKTNDSRDLALNIEEGINNALLLRDGNGVILGLSDYFECDGISTATITAQGTRIVDITLTVYPTTDTGNVLSGGITLLANGLTLNQDNIITLSNQTISTDVIFGDGFKGTIKAYKEELL